jgi:CRP/FNR family transcriptional regulator
MSTFQQFKSYLKHVSFLTDKDCDLFEPHLATKRYKAKDHFLREGGTCKEIGFINKGCFRTYYLANGEEVNTQFVFENEFVTDYDSFLNNKPSRYYIQALEDSEIIVFNLSAMISAYNLSHNWERFGRIIAEHSYIKTTERVESFLFLNGEQRYLDLLEKQAHLFDRIPLYHIASYLGLKRESLSRLRKKIAEK